LLLNSIAARAAGNTVRRSALGRFVRLYVGVEVTHLDEPDGNRRLGGRDPTARDEPEGNSIGIAACSFYEFFWRLDDKRMRVLAFECRFARSSSREQEYGLA